jgi:hypothetical protein
MKRTLLSIFEKEGRSRAARAQILGLAPRLILVREGGVRIIDAGE